MLVGANPDELKDLAGRMDDAATKVAPIHGQVLGLIERSPWEGPSAESYHRQWRDSKAQIEAAAGLLRAASDALRRNAEDQLRASAAEGGVIGASSTGPTGPADATTRADGEDEPETPSEITEMLEAVSGFLSGLGLAGDALEAVIETLTDLADQGLIDPALVMDLIGNETLVKALDLGGEVLGVADIFLTFATDMSENPDLPMDERLFHAAAVTAIGFAADKGIEAGATFLGGLVGSIIPVGGTAVGVIAGKAIGTVIAMGVDVFLGDAIDGAGEWAADQMTDLYRSAKEAVPTEVLDIGRDVVDGIVDAPGQVLDGIGDAGSAVVDKVKFW